MPALTAIGLASGILIDRRLKKLLLRTLLKPPPPDAPPLPLMLLACAK